MPRHWAPRWRRRPYDELHSRIIQLGIALSLARPGARIERSDIARECIAAGLVVLEERYGVSNPYARKEEVPAPAKRPKSK